MWGIGVYPVPGSGDDDLLDLREEIPHRLIVFGTDIVRIRSGKPKGGARVGLA